MSSPQTELHRHLDIATRLSTLWELSIQQGYFSQGTSLESFRKKVVLTHPLRDLREVIERFQLFQKVLQTPEIIERVGFEAVEDCYHEGTRKVELRFSPSFATEMSGISWKEATESFYRGMNKALKKFPDMKAGLICIATRDFGVEGCAQTTEFYLENKEFFCGIDLAGNEDIYPCRMFESIFKPIQKSGANITIHSGEATGPENVWEAIELLGARRIGHGVRSIEDPKLMKYLVEKNICLEICPTSNWLTQAIPNLEAHPLPKLLAAGIPISLNTDDPTIFGTSLPIEKMVCIKKLNMSENQLGQMNEFAHQFSFLNY